MTATLIILVLAIATTVWSQVIIIVPTAGTDTFPACAVSCPLLLQAQASCLPPAAPVTDQAIYLSCFCQSDLLKPLKNSPNGVCDAVCPAQSDLTALQAWYSGFCAAVLPPQATATNPSSTSSTTKSTGTAAGATATAAGSTPQAAQGPPRSWISTHWRWVVMLIVLILGFTGFTLLLIYLKRRYDSSGQHQSAAAVAVATGTMTSRANLDRMSGNSYSNPRPSGWGPQQHLAHTRDWDFVDAGPPESKRASLTVPQQVRYGPPAPRRGVGGGIGQAI